MSKQKGTKLSLADFQQVSGGIINDSVDALAASASATYRRPMRRSEQQGEESRGDRGERGGYERGDRGERGGYDRGDRGDRGGDRSERTFTRRAPRDDEEGAEEEAAPSRAESASAWRRSAEPANENSGSGASSSSPFSRGGAGDRYSSDRSGGDRYPSRGGGYDRDSDRNSGDRYPSRGGGYDRNSDRGGYDRNSDRGGYDRSERNFDRNSDRYPPRPFDRPSADSSASSESSESTPVRAANPNVYRPGAFRGVNVADRSSSDRSSSDRSSSDRSSSDRPSAGRSERSDAAGDDGAEWRKHSLRDALHTRERELQQESTTGGSTDAQGSGDAATATTSSSSPSASSSSDARPEPAFDRFAALRESSSRDTSSRDSAPPARGASRFSRDPDAAAAASAADSDSRPSSRFSRDNDASPSDSRFARDGPSRDYSRDADSRSSRFARDNNNDSYPSDSRFSRDAPSSSSSSRFARDDDSSSYPSRSDRSSQRPYEDTRPAHLRNLLGRGAASSASTTASTTASSAPSTTTTTTTTTTKATAPLPTLAPTPVVIEATTERYSEAVLKAVVSAEKKLSGLESAVNDGTTIVTDKVIKDDLPTMSLANAAGIADTIVRSWIAGKVTFAAVAGAVKSRPSAETVPLFVNVLKLYRTKKGDQALLKALDESKVSFLSLVAPDVAVPSPELDAVLKTHDLLVLKPIPNLAKIVEDALAGKTATAAELVQRIDEIVLDKKLPLPDVVRVVSKHVFTAAFAAKVSVDLSVIDAHVPLLKRMAFDSSAKVAMLVQAQLAWNAAGTPKLVLVECFEHLLSKARVVKDADVVAWRDGNDKSVGKPKALLQLGKWLTAADERVKAALAKRSAAADDEDDEEDIDAELDEEFQ